MKVISSKEVLRNKLFTVVDEVATDASGFQIHRSIVRHPGSAVMMAVDEHERVLLVQQYRLPAEMELWELPAGRIDPGETPLQAAKRELREETGYSAKNWRKLVTFWASPGYIDEKMTLFLATDLTEGEQEPMEDERIELRWFSERELGEAVTTNKVMDAKTLLGYFFWLEHRKADRQKATRSSTAAP
jgi:ADP-ribose pyrophosphatase